MDFTHLYETFRARAWFEADRWKQYFEGLATTVQVTVMALIIGVILGVVVAMIRTAHDQQRLGRRNPFLGVVNFLCKIYVTIIRGTPMMVQLLIMGLVIFASNRNKTMIGALSLGINSGAYVAEIPVRTRRADLSVWAILTPCDSLSSLRPSRQSSLP